MGDMFLAVEAKCSCQIDKQKISTQEFMNYLNNLDLDEKEKNLKNSDLVEKNFIRVYKEKNDDFEIKNIQDKNYRQFT